MLIPHTFYNSKITNLIDIFIKDGQISYNDLDSIEKEYLTSFCIENLGTDCYACIIEPENFSKIINEFSNYMRTGKQEYARDLVEIMQKNAVEYFADILTQLFDERFNDIEVDRKIDSGLTRIVDKVNGEISYINLGLAS